MIDLYFDTLAGMLRLWPPDLHRVYSGLTSRQGWFMSLKRVTYLISPGEGALPRSQKGASAPSAQEAVPAAVLLLVQVLIANPPILW